MLVGVFSVSDTSENLLWCLQSTLRSQSAVLSFQILLLSSLCVCCGRWCWNFETSWNVCIMFYWMLVIVATASYVSEKLTVDALQLWSWHTHVCLQPQLHFRLCNHSVINNDHHWFGCYLWYGAYCKISQENNFYLQLTKVIGNQSVQPFSPHGGFLTCLSFPLLLCTWQYKSIHLTQIKSVLIETAQSTADQLPLWFLFEPVAHRSHCLRWLSFITEVVGSATVWWIWLFNTPPSVVIST